jgi:endonuclease/exonuclease/phosphatase family metal-dependent hydrolase
MAVLKPIRSCLAGLREKGALPRLVRSRWDYLAVVPAEVALFAAIAAVVPPRSGPLALALVLEEHVFIAAFAVLAPVALLARARALGLALAVLVATGGCFFGSEWISVPGVGGAARHDLAVMTWNLQYGSRSPAEAAAQLETADVDLVALQELEPDSSAAIEADATITTRFPYRAMSPQWGAWGLAILSRYPIRDVQTLAWPARLQLVVETPRGPIRVINAHPTHAAFDTVTPLRLPIGYDPSERDDAIAVIRQWIDPTFGTGERLLVLGDFNTCPTEPEYAVLTRGLRDTHREVGEGPGWTWRPSRFTFLAVAFLRIDLQLSAGAIYPASTGVDCAFQGDHCRLFGAYEID